MDKNKRGFTLIELLAVIVILAIIALIAVPVIMNVINKARKSAFEDSVYGVIKAAELYYSNQLLEPEGMTSDKEFIITDGAFVGDALEVSGSLPKTGKIKVTKDGDVALALSDGEYYVQKTITEDEIVVKSLKEDNINEEELDYKQETGSNEETNKVNIFTTSDINPSVPICITNNTECAAGTGVAIKVNDTTTYDFYVMSDNTSENEITLIMDKNLGDTIAWITKEDYLEAGGTESDWGESGNNNKGPITALKALEDRTSTWINIPEKTYQVIDEDNSYSSITRTARARLITGTEASELGCTSSSGSCPTWLYGNLSSSGPYGYWTSSAFEDSSGAAWRVVYVGFAGSSSIDDDGDYGIRPVITISKNTL